MLEVGYGARRSIAVDIVSGVNADTGHVLSKSFFDPVPASTTVTFQSAKQGHVLDRGGCLSGDVEVASIGLENEFEEIAGEGASVSLFHPAKVRSAEFVSKSQGQHKYDHGHVLVLSGGPGKGRAARLAARGALRTGAGPVTVGVPRGALQVHAAQPTAIMLEEIATLIEVRKYSTDRRVNACCLGRGFGVGAATRTFVRCAAESEMPFVLDADTLTAFEKEPLRLFEMLHRKCVLKPHAGEFKRLFPDIAAS